MKLVTWHYWDYKPIIQLFVDVINQVKSVMIVMTSIQPDFFATNEATPQLIIRKNAGLITPTKASLFKSSSCAALEMLKHHFSKLYHIINWLLLW